MTRAIWIKTLGRYAEAGTPSEQRLAKLSLALIVHPDRVEQILDSTAKEIMDGD